MYLNHLQKLGTRVSLSRGLERELSLIWGPVQNLILHSRGPKYAECLRHSASLAKAYQENLDTFRILVSISAVRECVTKTLQTHQSSRDALTHVPGVLGFLIKGDKKRKITNNI